MFRRIGILGLISGTSYQAIISKSIRSNCEGATESSKKSRYNYDWDHRQYLYENKEGKEKVGKGVIHQIVLVRHGQYEQVRGGDELHVLTPLGREQAIQTGKRIGALIEGGVVHPVKNIYYSTMSRATETFELIHDELKAKDLLPPAAHQIKPCSMIREGAVCKPIPPASRWDVTEEDFVKDHLRVEAAFGQHFNRSEPDEESPYSTLLVCHGNIIRYMVLKALQLPTEAWLRTAVWNASITIVEIYPNGKVSLRCFGDVGHLPPKHVTYS